MVAHNRPGKCDASSAYTQSDSSAEEALEAKSDIYDCLVFIWSTSFNRQKLQWFYLDGCEAQQ